jgi:excisionase family DNA binding protein
VDAFGDSPVLLMLQELIAALMKKVEKLEEVILEIMNKLLGGVPFEEKEYYTPKELSKLNGLKVETIREYLKEGRIEGTRTKSGRGGIPEWRIPRDEVRRYLDEGLLEPGYRYRHPR